MTDHRTGGSGQEPADNGTPVGEGTATETAERTGPQVYQPAEDSWLLAQTALDHVTADDYVLDVGTGTGFVGEHVAAETGASVVGVDINPHACHAAREAGLSVVQGDLCSPFAAGSFDVVLCNPPYLPPEDRTADDWMATALESDDGGRAVINRFIEDVGRVLRKDGRALILVSSQTDSEAVREYARSCGFAVATAATEEHFFETLVVLELTMVASA